MFMLCSVWIFWTSALTSFKRLKRMRGHGWVWWKTDTWLKSNQVTFSDRIYCTLTSSIWPIYLSCSKSVTRNWILFVTIDDQWNQYNQTRNFKIGFLFLDSFFSFWQQCDNTNTLLLFNNTILQTSLNRLVDPHGLPGLSYCLVK